MVKKVPNSNEEYSKLLTSQNNLLEHARKLENCNIKRVTQKFIILSPTTAQELLSFYVENTGDEKLSYIPLIFSSKSVLADLTIEDNLGNCLLPPSDKVDKMVCIWILDKIIGLVYPLRMKVKYIKPILSSFWEGKVEEKIKQMIKNIIEDNLIIKESFKSSKSFDKIKSDSERYLYDLLKKKGLINSNKKKNKFNEDLYKYIKENNQLLEKVLVAINKKAFIETVNKNLLLFQYVLGPNVTAEKLLEKVASPNETLFSALNNDVTLVGIVLGYGSYNGCFGSYLSRIDKFLEHNNENLPLISRKIIFTKKYQDKSKFFQKYNEKFMRQNIFPSFGYLSLKEEYNDLVKRLFVLQNALLQLIHVWINRINFNL
ncbi:hypothetical protein LCGC14_2477350 [marine sediment metagenome]|uniref:Uncharacterized protein n=1 Tax=marine sediment metagenome TaxID=412755 RepID=A0A0F9B8L7_9ZZZZ